LIEIKGRQRLSNANFNEFFEFVGVHLAIFQNMINFDERKAIKINSRIRFLFIFFFKNG